MINKNILKKGGFTLIELLVVMSILAVLSSIAMFSIGNIQENARNTKRRADLENIRTAMELFFSDCGQYPPPSGSNRVRSPMRSSDSSVNNVNCPASPANVYMTEVPEDPRGAPYFYYYSRPTLTSFAMCAHIEGSSDPTPAGCPSGANACGGGPCNHILAGP